MESFAQENPVLGASINLAPFTNSLDRPSQKNTTLRGPIGPAPDHDRFGEEVPTLRQEWYANCTADSSIEALQRAEHCSANRITFDTKYTISYFTKENVLIKGPIDDYIEEPVQVKKLTWNRERISEPAYTVHFTSDQANDLQEPAEMELNALERRKQNMAIVNIDTNPKVSQSTIINQRADDSITTPPTTSYEDKPAMDVSFGNTISNTVRNMSTTGLQVVNDLDEKAASRAQFTSDLDRQFTDEDMTTIPTTRRHDKSSTNSSLGSRVSSTMRNLAEMGIQVINDLDEKAAHHARFSLDSPTPVDQEPIESIQSNPFEKWLHTIKRRGAHRKTASCDIPRNGAEVGFYEGLAIKESRPGHRKSLSGSSFGFVSNMKSVGTSLASFSIAPRSRTGMSSRHQRTDYSSRASCAVSILPLVQIHEETVSMLI